jgi:putative peptidoglycan lipid II flippase
MSILRSAFTVSFFIFLSRICGFVRDVFIAQFLGVSYFSDVFFAAFRLPNFFRRVFGEGALNNAFVPIFVEKKDDKKVFVQNVFSLLFYALLLFTLILQIFMPFFMKIFFPGFLQVEKSFELLVALSRITIFYLIFISLVSLLSAVLNSLGKFAIPSSAPIILNLTLIASFFVFGNIAPNYAYALSYGVFVAGILQFAYLMFFTYRQGIFIYPKLPSLKVFADKDIKKFFKKLLPGVIGANVMQINLLIDSIFASLIFGAMSYLYYADRVNQLPLAMIGIAIGVALLPMMSRKIQEEKKDEAIKLQNLALEVCLILVIPAALALNALSYPIISTLFERGKFTSYESLMVAKALGIYACGLPAYVLVKVMEPAFFARGDTKTPMQIAFSCLFSNLVFNSLFYLANFGFVGIALSSVLSSYLNLTLMIFLLVKRDLFYFEDDFAKKLLKIMVPAILMFFFLIFLNGYFLIKSDFSDLVELILMMVFGALFYFIFSFLSGSLNVLIKSKLFKKRVK